jgi:hypothetical protein
LPIIRSTTIDLAGTWLDRHLDSLDGACSLFLQGDVDEFAKYRSALAKSIHDTGATAAASVIFARFLQRLQQRASNVADTLQRERVAELMPSSTLVDLRLKRRFRHVTPSRLRSPA